MSAKILVFFFIALSAVIPASTQELKAYQIFTKNGDKTSFSQLSEDAHNKQLVLFGELHNNPISHWIQLELTHSLHDRKQDSLILGMEMFEADVQLIIDEYFAGLISERSFQQESRPWNNYDTDIRPLAEFARENNLKLIATNIPRRYASLVNREGFEGLENLQQEARQYIAPLPPPYDAELPSYKSMLEMTGMHGNTNENFPKAQAIKDATMAHFILKNLDKDKTMIHFHGAFHTDNFEGIVWYIQQYAENIPDHIIISTVEQDNIDSLSDENKGIADYIIVVPANMTKTY
ncbi:MAG: ChaN family lipoprotein [Bacteroidota bacterium]